MRILTVLALLLAAALPLGAQQARFPEPEFEKPHPLPQTTQPSARSLTLEYVDLAALVAAMGLAAWLVLKVRSRRPVFLLMAASLLYFGFWREGCVCAVGSIQNVVLAIFSDGYTMPLTAAAIFLLPLLFALLFGRVFCAAVCPLGAAQDAVILKPARVPPWLSRFLGTLPYVYLGLAVLAAATGADFLICRYDPFVGFFRMGAPFEMLLLGAAFLIVGTVVARPYCRFLCPYGVLLKWMSSLSRRHLTITPSECTQCRLCEDSCPFDLILRPSPAREPEGRRAGVRRLGWLFALLPVLAGAGIGAGLLAHAPLSRIHSTVRLAERVALEKSGKVPETTVETRAFYETDKAADALYAEAAAIRGRFRTGSILLGAFLGLTVGVRLIAFSVRRRSPDYRPDRADCFSCGRCMPYCPVGKKPESMGMPG